MSTPDSIAANLAPAGVVFQLCVDSNVVDEQPVTPAVLARIAVEAIAEEHARQALTHRAAGREAEVRVYDGDTGLLVVVLDFDDKPGSG